MIGKERRFAKGQTLQCSCFEIEILNTSLFEDDKREKERWPKCLCHKVVEEVETEAEYVRDEEGGSK